MRLLYERALLVAWFMLPQLVYAQKASQAPAQQTFNLSADNLRALQNSVNLFTGQVTFPMELAALPGRGGMNMSIGIQYNSIGVRDAVDIENIYSPTGVLGLGWSLDIPRIVADNKQTGTRQDDTFYLVENGISNVLICTRSSLNLMTFQTKNFTAWKIEYHPDDEYWTIIRENGMRYHYYAVQWAVKWGNWIGNSAQTQNQGRSAYVWALGTVENSWQDRISFYYDLVEEPVGSGGLSHTKAFYLSKISDPLGQEIELTYQPKTSNEYVDPHQERGEPDAYQEKYETKYLSSLTVRSINHQVLYSVNLDFEVVDGDRATAKRYLKSIQKTFPSGESQPAVGFEYFKSGSFNGCLKTVTNSLGSNMEYYYKDMAMSGSAYVSTINAPSGYGQAKTYVAGDYCVITWRKLKSDGSVDSNPQPVKVQVVYWDGGWRGAVDLWNIPGINATDYEKADIAVQSTHFIYLLYSSNSNQYYVTAAHLKPRAATGAMWETMERLYTKEGKSDPYDISSVHAGEDFACFCVRWLQDIQTFTWRDEKWQTGVIRVGDDIWENYITTGVNFIFVHNDKRGAADRLHLFWLNAEKEWVQRQVPVSLAFSSDGDNENPSYWHASNSFVFGMVEYNPEYVYMWDENYNNFIKTNAIGEYQDAALVATFNDGFIGVSQTNHPNGVALRYDGKNWYPQTYGYESYEEVSYAPDLMVRADKPFSYNPPTCQAFFFDPNTRQWDYNTYGSTLEFDHLNILNRHAIQAGNDVFMRNQWLMRRDVGGAWTYGETIPMSNTEYLIGKTAVVMAPNYIAYEYSWNARSSVKGVYILYLKNNKVEAFENLQDQKLDVTKTNAGLSILALQSITSPGTIVYLHRIAADRRSQSSATAMVVSATMWSDGNHTFKTGYSYYNGKVNSAGIAQFNLVEVGEGDSDVGSRNGVTGYYFYNGLPGQSLLGPSPNAHAGQENLLVGLPYAVVTSKSTTPGTTEISRVTNDYTVTITPVVNTLNDVVSSVSMVRCTQTTHVQDGISTTTQTSYDLNTGLPKTTTQVISPGGGVSEALTTTNTYWWEIYDPGRTRNLLSPVVQTKSTNQRSDGNGQTSFTSVTATKWKHNTSPDAYFPSSTYVWKHSGSADFVAWDDGTSPSDDWLLTEKVNELTSVSGTALETEQNDGSITAVLLDGMYARVLGSAKFSDRDQIAYTSFEDEAQGNWSYNTSYVTGSDASAGARSFFAPFTASAQIRSKNLPEGIYEVSFWSKRPSALVAVENGSVLETFFEETHDGWQLARASVQIPSGGGVVIINVPAGSWVDEARLRPRGAEMTTYVYDKTGNVLVETDTNLFQTRFEYDTQYRLSVVRDHQGRVVKKYEYHYRNQQ